MYFLRNPRQNKQIKTDFVCINKPYFIAGKLPTQPGTCQNTQCSAMIDPSAATRMAGAAAPTWHSLQQCLPTLRPSTQRSSCYTCPEQTLHLPSK